MDEDKGMSIEQWKLIKRLKHCTFYPDSWDKKFVKSLVALAEADEWWMIELSPKRAYYLLMMGYKYREQLRNYPDPITKNRVADMPEPPPFVDGQEAPEFPDLPQQPSLF